MMAIALDLDLTAEDVSRLTSADALAAFFQRMGYSTSKRTTIPAQAVGLDGLSDLRSIELLSEDTEGFLRVLFVQLRSITAAARNKLVRTFGQQNQDYLLVLTSDFEALEFVLTEKVRRQRKGPGGDSITRPQAKVFVVPRRWPQNMLRIVRRLTFTARDEAGNPDAILQYAKLVSVFDAAHYSGEYFQNRALFADHYLRTRLPEDPAWKEAANEAFAAVSSLMRQARDRFGGKDKAMARQELFEPLFKALGFIPQAQKKSTDPDPQPDYRLPSASGQPRTAALVYAWERWLDGPDAADPDTPNENPGAAVVTLLERGDADWVIVTNGKLWRLYSRHAHSRSTNFYEVDLEDALLATGQTDPNEAFRYWWLFFRESAFAAMEERDGKKTCWLDRIAAGSRDYAREVEAELKRRVFYEVVPHLAAGFLEDRRTRLKQGATPTDAELEQVREGTLTLLYRILFLLYAESRDLLPVRESAYYQISVKKLKDEIAEAAGIAETQADEKLAATYKRGSTALYDRLGELFAVMDGGDLKRNRAYNVPVYNGGLFRVTPQEDAADEREARIARFLLDHKVPDLFLASALDRLSRVPDQKTFGLAFVDYKSLGVRQLGSIYEGLLEFRLKIADEDLPPVSEKGKRKATRLSAARGTKDRTGVKKGEPYLANDKSERKATGSYYTPDHIVQYIVEHTVGPVLTRKLDALRPAFREAEKTYHRELDHARSDPRCMAGVVPQRLDAKGIPLARSDEDFHAFALHQTYQNHKDLVEKLFDVKVLDPAMGSGHFLVEAVDFITDTLLHFLNGFPANPVTAAMERTRRSILDSLKEQGIETDALLEKQLTDVHLIKRHVLKRCIYGVDLNPLATELAKVSLWLDAFTIGAPLSFLDHHVRVGNSLIGATVAQVQDALHESQMTLFGSRFAGLKLAAIGMAAIGAMPDATADQVKLSQREYHKASDALAPFKRIFDAYLMQWFLPDDVAAALPPRRRGSAEHPALEFLKSKEAEPFFSAAGDEQVKSALDKLQGADRKLAEAIVHVAKQRRFLHWELEFPEAFYEPRAGTKQTVERMDNPGFDAVIGNPPYDVLSEKETGQDLEAIQAFIKNEPLYQPSVRGKNNYYKLFICRAVGSQRRSSRLGFITPMAVLGDDQAAGIRRLFRDSGAFTAIEAFPQKDDPERRVFPEAKLSTATFIFHRTDDPQQRTIPFVSRVHPAQFIEPDSPSLRLSMEDIALYDPENLTVVSCSQPDWDLAVKIMGNGRLVRLSSVATFYQGEINETNERRKGNIGPRESMGPRVLRASGVCLYVVREPSQKTTGDLFVDVRKFMKGKDPDAKAHFYREDRVGIQGNAPQNNFRRLIAAHIPAGTFCFYTINFAPASSSKASLNCLLGALNSKLCEWHFRLGSTSAHANQYQLDVLPFPRFDDKLASDDELALSKARCALNKGDMEACWSVLRPLCDTPPFSPAIREIIVEAVGHICQIEAQRGEIARSERSHLDPKAQPYQDLIDRILYALAGLTEAESRALEERLAKML